MLVYIGPETVLIPWSYNHTLIECSQDSFMTFILLYILTMYNIIRSPIVLLVLCLVNNYVSHAEHVHGIMDVSTLACGLPRRFLNYDSLHNKIAQWATKQLQRYVHLISSQSTCSMSRILYMITNNRHINQISVDHAIALLVSTTTSRFM